LPAQPVKIEFLREIFEKSRGFASVKTKLDAGSEANSAASFVFSLAKRDFARNFEYERDFFKAAPAITLLLHFDLFFHGMRFWNKKAGLGFRWLTSFWCG
jgi:hypothetical protein